jgi:pyrrolidone-carboxylate peptidase
MGIAGTPRRLLLAAFEPFGARADSARPENASETVLRAWAKRHAGRHAVVILPVDPRCEVVLARALHDNPAGVVALGEAGLPGAWDTNVEVRARDLPIVAARSAGAPAPAKAATLSSDFAPTLALPPGMEREDRIGSFWCNRTYYRVLQWCNLFGRPSVFLHLRVDGDRARQGEHLAQVVERMEQAATRGGRPVGVTAGESRFPGGPNASSPGLGS